jgi:hypothetical protein
MTPSQKTDSTSNFVTRLIDDLEPAMLDFIKSNVNSFIKWDLLRLFYENHDLIDTPENVAKYAGRTVAVIERELEDLVTSGLMIKKGLNGIPSTYSLASDEKTWSLISQFISACEDRHFRIKVVYHIVQGIQSL